jgi:L-alanine-DL-glutamate epimerase-like enolase superfamily enzyme
MMPDDEAWLTQCRKRIDDAKIAVESNGRLAAQERVELASQLESVFKRARGLVEPGDG